MLQAKLDENKGLLTIPFRDREVTFDVFMAIDDLVAIEEVHRNSGAPKGTQMMADVALFVGKVAGVSDVTRGEASMVYAILPATYELLKKKQVAEGKLLAESLVSTGSIPVSGVAGT